MSSASGASTSEQDIRLDVPEMGGRIAATIEGKLSDRQTSLAFVLTHPYGPLGGDMSNNVVIAITRYLNVLGFTTFRFNFRGVGGSTGRSTWRGWGERDDVRAACSHLLGLPKPPQQLVLIGYSYGSLIASAVSGDLPEVIGYVSISHPFGVAWFLTLFRTQAYASHAKTDKPKLFIMGDTDNFTKIGQFQQSVKDYPSPLDVITVRILGVQDLRTAATRVEGGLKLVEGLADKQEEI